jgi:hypothetical protein
MPTSSVTDRVPSNANIECLLHALDCALNAIAVLRIDTELHGSELCVWIRLYKHATPEEVTKLFNHTVLFLQTHQADGLALTWVQDVSFWFEASPISEFWKLGMTSKDKGLIGSVTRHDGFCHYCFDSDAITFARHIDIPVLQ